MKIILQKKKKMPYELKKDKAGYFVITKETKKKHSKKPLSKANAEAQLRVLEMIYKKSKV